jgi:NAD(P)-dependent dehydrogenase (short-subunit alcohol dehydrogenase family)
MGRRPAPLEAVASELGATVALADVTDREAVDRAFGEARRAHGPVTLLIANAGAAESAPFGRIDADAWRRAMAVNLDAVFHCCQAALPDLKAARAGRIVTVASTAGLKGYAYSAAYTAAKHGAVGLMRALAAELAGTNITANAVCPGFTDTDLVARSVATISAKTGRSAEEARADLAHFNPQGRLIDPQEVASIVLWLCLPEQRSMTGQAIAIAGGEV